jgi:dephospho-CoA kinase
LTVAVEETLVLVKPDGVARNLTGEILRRIEEQTDTDNVVVLDIPLLVESGYPGLLGTIVVDLDPEVAITRLIEFRDFSEDDARARIAKQATREQRLEKADFVVDNSGTPDDLPLQIDALWEWIGTLESDSRPAEAVDG